MIHCAKCGVVPVPKDQLPVNLPEMINFNVKGNPLDRRHGVEDDDLSGMPGRRDARHRHAGYLCGFLLVLRPLHRSAVDTPVNKEAADYWLPVDQYIGGIEHAILHLLYRAISPAPCPSWAWSRWQSLSPACSPRAWSATRPTRMRDGNWVSPEEIEKRDGKAFERDTGKEITVGPSEKMSKSKKNAIAPEDHHRRIWRRYHPLVHAVGHPAGTRHRMDRSGRGRLLALCPAGVASGHRKHRPGSGRHPPSTDEASKPLRQAAHKAIAAVTDDLENLRFNRAVAQLYTLANVIGGAEKVDGAARREAIEALVLLCAPMMPHLAEQCWKELGHDTLVAQTPWPKYDPALTASDSVTIAIQVNGKRRGEISMAKDADSKAVEAAALAEEGVVRALDGKAPKKVIVVPNRIVNIVA